MSDLQISILVVSIVIVLAIGFFVLEYIFVKKKKKVHIDDSFINRILESLGGINNVLNIKTEHDRLIFELADLDLINAINLKALTETGVFITGNNVKVLFNEDANSICQKIKSLKGN